MQCSAVMHICVCVWVVLQLKWKNQWTVWHKPWMGWKGWVPTCMIHWHCLDTENVSLFSETLLRKNTNGVALILQPLLQNHPHKLTCTVSANNEDHSQFIQGNTWVDTNLTLWVQAEIKYIWPGSRERSTESNIHLLAYQTHHLMIWQVIQPFYYALQPNKPYPQSSVDSGLVFRCIFVQWMCMHFSARSARPTLIPQCGEETSGRIKSDMEPSLAVVLTRTNRNSKCSL